MNLAIVHNRAKVHQGSSTLTDTYNNHASLIETGVSWALADTLSGGIGPGPEENYNEIFYVIDGEVEVKSEIFQYTAKKGSYVIISPGQELKSLKNNTNKKVSLLWL